MPNENAKRDGNNVPVAMGVSSSTGLTQAFRVDSQGRLLISATTSASLAPTRFSIPLVCGSSSAFQTVLGGAGAVLGVSSTYRYTITTNTTANAGLGIGYAIGSVTSAMTYYDWDPEIQVTGKLADTISGGAFVSFIGCSQNTFPTSATGVFTSKHFGFMALNNTIYATMADGTTQTLVECVANVTDAHIFRMSLQPTYSACYFYIDNVLQATMTGSFPTGSFSTNVPLSASIQNDPLIIENRILTIGNASFTFNAS